jgi:hypothetical protein
MQSVHFLYPKGGITAVQLEGHQNPGSEGEPPFALLDLWGWTSKGTPIGPGDHIVSSLALYAEAPEQLEHLADVATKTAAQLRCILSAKNPRAAAILFGARQCIVCHKPVPFRSPMHEQAPYCGDCDQRVRDLAAEREAAEVALVEAAERQMEQRQSEHERADADGEVETTPHAEDAHADSAPLA